MSQLAARMRTPKTKPPKAIHIPEKRPYGLEDTTPIPPKTDSTATTIPNTYKVPEMGLSNLKSYIFYIVYWFINL